MTDLTILAGNLAWPVAILAIWFLGEWLHRHIRLPRISVYAFCGFALASTQAGLLPAMRSDVMTLVANIALSLVMFECGHRINLRWLWTNPWMAVTSATESLATFAAVFGLLSLAGQPQTTALMMAALAMATSPATLLRTIHELRASGQATERALHFSVFSSVLAVFLFKIIVGFAILKTSGSLAEAAGGSLLTLAASLGIGAGFGLVVPAALRLIGATQQGGTVAFVLSVIVLVVLTHGLLLSPVLATLTFGIVCRQRRIVLGASQRGFGTLGDILSVLLFVFIASTLDWRHVWAGLVIGVALVLLRQAVKTAAVCLFARKSGLSMSKGVLTGLALSPISAFVILVLEQSRHLGVYLVDQLAPLAAAALLLEILSPLLIRHALTRAGETPERKE